LLHGENIYILVKNAYIKDFFKFTKHTQCGDVGNIGVPLSPTHKNISEVIFIVTEVTKLKY
jgi:hypothetical protein